MIKKVHMKGERQKHCSYLQQFMFFAVFFNFVLGLGKSFYDNAPKNVQHLKKTYKTMVKLNFLFDTILY